MPPCNAIIEPTAHDLNRDPEEHGTTTHLDVIVRTKLPLEHDDKSNELGIKLHAVITEKRYFKLFILSLVGSTLHAAQSSGLADDDGRNSCESFLPN